MTDEIDAAQERQLLINETCIKAALAPLAVTGCQDCQGCGDKISEPRRAAFPSARYCIDCQRIRERKTI